MKFHRFWSFFWNWAIDRKHKWLFKLFKNYKCISFYDKEEPLTVWDLWESNNFRDKDYTE